MKPSYQGNAKPYAVALFHAADAEQVMPLLEEIDRHGLNLSYQNASAVRKNVIKRACAVIAFLTAQSGADQKMERAILLAKAMDVPLVCVKLDQAPLTESLNHLLYTSNIIFAERYQTPALLSERILTAESLIDPKVTPAQIEAARLMALLTMAGALVVVAVAGLLIFQAFTKKAEPEPPDIAGILSSGMTEEDLQEIRTLILVGDTMIDANELRNYRDWSEAVSKMEIDGETVWSIDGEQIARGTATDISLIGRMSKLEDLILLNQSVTDISPLQSLTRLSYVEFVDCPVESLEALSGMTVLRGISLEKTQVTSLKPLESCTNLDYFSCNNEHFTSLDGLGIPALREITLSSADGISDLDALSACSGLVSFNISGATQLKDISGLAGCEALTYLTIYDAEDLHGCEALTNLTGIREVYLGDIGITDLSPLQNSRGLMKLDLENVPIRSLAWTAGMDQLHYVKMHGTNMRSMDFLKNLGVDAMELHFSGDFSDYSGLAAIPYYSYMHLNPKNQNLGAVLPYIVNATFSRLQLYDCNGIDFATLPQNINVLQITKGNLSSLEGISILPKMNTLHLEEMSRLSSLSGLAECQELTRITIQNCIRLTDYEALYQKPYALIALLDLSTAPDLSRLQISGQGDLTLERMTCIGDIGPLSACQTEIGTLRLKDMDSLYDLSPIQKINVNELIVSPELEEQAQILMEEGAITTYYVEYPEDELWVEEEQNFSLLSLAELDTLPDVLLQRVKELNVVGDCVLDTESQGWTDQWENNEEFFFVVDYASGATTPVGPGIVSEIGSIGKLTNLQILLLHDQPITSLQGIQSMTDLRCLWMRKCPLTDASAVFTLTRLEQLSLFDTDITSIQGIQNLSKLILVDFNSSQVEDISPLSECDFTYAMENGGLQLQLGFTPCEDFSPLASIPGFASLNVEGHAAALWLPYLEGKQVTSLYANHCELTNDQIALIAAIPGLQEVQLCWNEKLTDLTPLLSCTTLTKVVLNDYSTEAIASIEGKARFAIEYR